MTKHQAITLSSTFIAKFSKNDWCHLCGKRPNKFIEISYPVNAELELTLLEQQGNQRLQYTNISEQLEQKQQQQQDHNFIRICKRCLKHSINILDSKDDGNIKL